MGIVPDLPGQAGPAAGMRPRRMFIVGNLSDIDLDGEGFKALSEKYGKTLGAINISADEKTNLEELKRQLFSHLGIIRVHTKSPGARVDLSDPVILETDATIKDAAEAVHKDFAYKLRYAVVWGSGKFDGQRVGPEHVLRDNDIIELHI